MRNPESGHEIDPLYGAIGGPLYAVHSNGCPYAAFSGPNQALAFMRGLGRDRGWFHIENAGGERVRLEDNPHHPGHAQAIVEALDR